VPYRGAAPAVQDLVAGHVHIMFDSVTLQMPHLTAGATRPLAVLTPERVSVLPNVPTMAEAGYAEMQGGTWFGLFAPAGTPRPVVERIAAEVRRIWGLPEVVAALSKLGAEPVVSTPDEFTAFARAERVKWGEVVRAAGVRID
jgi:tripartite-type tricarboxylate transporter receptor subunit TctC